MLTFVQQDLKWLNRTHYNTQHEKFQEDRWLLGSPKLSLCSLKIILGRTEVAYRQSPTRLHGRICVILIQWILESIALLPMLLICKHSNAQVISFLLC